MLTIGDVRWKGSVGSMPVVSVVNTKGGTAKTTSSIFLAAAAVYDGETVILADADPQGSAAAWFYAAQEDHQIACDLVAANTQTLARLPQEQLCIVDTGPSNPAMVEAAIRAADLVVIPTAPALTDLDRLWETLKVVEGTPAAVLLTQVNLQAVLYRQIRDALEAEGVLVFPTPILRRESFRQAFGQWPKPGRGLVGYDDVFTDIKKGLA